MPSVELEPYRKKYLKTYVKFAQEGWGGHCHQSSENYINWLYKENPCATSSKEGFTLALFEGKIIGCIHKMQLMWRVKKQIESIPAIHNLIVAENHRRKGCGILLLKDSFAGENHALVPGVIKGQENIYKFLKCQKINSLWYRKILTPLRGTYYLAKKRLFNYNAPPAFFTSDNFHKIRNLSSHVKVTIQPNDDLIEKVISLLNKESPEMISMHWDMGRFKWRFFHPLGPRHLLIYKESENEIKDFLILSLGPKKGLNIARIIEVEASSLETLDLLMKMAEKATKLIGGHLLLNFSTSPRLTDLLAKLKYKLIKSSPDTFFYHKNKKAIFHSSSFNGSAGDFGFESIS